MQETATVGGGRELDAEVAEKVMGVQHWPRFAGDVAGYWCARDHNGEPWHAVPCEECVIDEEAPRYSTDWSDAALVVEVMYVRGFRLRLEHAQGSTPTHPLWYACFYRRAATHDYRNADTVPHAICRAALAAVGTR